MSKKVVYSTGPVENQNSDGSLYPADKLFSTVKINTLNNHKKKTATVIIRVFKLNGNKMKVESSKYKVGPKSNKTRELDVSQLDRFEIRIRIKGTKQSVLDSVLISATGKDSLGGIIRELPLTRIRPRG